MLTKLKLERVFIVFFTFLLISCSDSTPTGTSPTVAVTPTDTSPTVAVTPTDTSPTVAVTPTDTSAQKSSLPLTRSSTVMPLNPGHYILATKSISGDIINTLLANPEIKGVSTIYNWVDLEIQKGVYDFSSIANDLALLRPLNKQLIIMVRDKSFKNDLFIPVPSYMLSNEYQGGYAGGKNSRIAKRWVHKVGLRFRALISALGNQFDQDPNFEAIKTSESATGDIHQFTDYDPIQYVNELNFTASALARSFPNTVKIMYLNWLPGAQDRLAEVAAYAKISGVGIGGPDVHPDIQIPSYGLYTGLVGSVPLMTDVQWSNFEHVSPLGDSNQLLKFATSNLNVSYVCWMLKKPYVQNIIATIKANPIL